jgi:amino acid adenylation domain-containing protein
VTAPPEDVGALWERVLAATAGPVHDDFFRSGGDEAAALRLAAEVWAAYGQHVSLENLFRRPIRDHLADLVRRGAPAGQPVPRPERAAVSPDARSPLSPVQLASWLGRNPGFELGAVGHDTYIEAEVTDLDLGRYVEAWRAVVARHDTMRTTVTAGGEPSVSAEAPADVVAAALTVEHLADLEPEQQEHRLAAIRDEMRRRTRDATRTPLFEVRVSTLNNGRNRLHVALDALIADARSVDVIGQDLAAAYHGRSAAGPGPQLHPSFVRTQLGNAGTGERAWQYWQGRLAMLPPAPQLPTAIDAKLLEEPRFTRRTATIPVAQWRSLRARAAEVGVTPEVLLLAAFGDALAAWSKDARFIVGALRDQRHFVPLDLRLVGQLMHLTVTEVDADPQQSYRERVQALQRQVWQDLDHRQVDGATVLDELVRLTGQPVAAAAPITFSSRLDGSAMKPNGWALHIGGIIDRRVQAPQTWLHQDVVTDATGGLMLVYDSVDNLLAPSVADDMLAYHIDLLMRLAEGEAAWDETGHECLPERQQAVRTRINDTEVALPDLLLHEPFWAQADRTPDAPAVFAVDRTLTYRQLRAGAAALADELATRGAGPNKLVAIVMDKGWEHPLSTLGILAAGAAYVPVEPDLPEERFHYLLDHSQARMVLTQPHLVDALPWPDGVDRIVVDAAFLDAPDQPERQRMQRQSDLAYIIYTSGSTGLPKGVMISHRGAVNTVLDINRRFGVGPSDRMLALTPLSFDLSVYDLFGPFAVGGALVMPEAGSGRAPWHWAELLEQHQVTLWNTVPALMEMLTGYSLGRRQRIPDSLRLVLLSGDWIPLPLPERIRSLAAQGIEVISLGGATEGSIWSIYHDIAEIDPTWVSIPYGTPLDNQQIEVLDDAMRRRPDWVPGEQYIGGHGVAMGYWRDETKTRRSFVTHPRTGRRLYRTGDLGRYYPDGSIEFLGREDFQVKIHGYRIELGEIEAALLAHDSVGSAVVTAIGKARGEKRLVAYVTPPDEPGVGPAAVDEPDVLAKVLREYLASKLPAYMVPAHIMPLERLPLTRNGKVDRQALPLPTSRQVGAEAVEPEDETSVLLLAEWRDVLGDNDLTVDDDIFARGANRADVLTVYRRAGAAAGMRLPDMFVHHTIRSLVQTRNSQGS